MTGKGIRVLPLGELGGIGEGQVTRSENLDYFGGGAGYAERKPGLLLGRTRLRGAKTWATFGEGLARIGWGLGGL